MALYRIDNHRLKSVQRTTFVQQNLRELQDLQKMLKANIEIISPDTLIVAEEFGDWDDSKRRIDLLGIDKNACLIVIELKRTDDGGHMELQSLRYAAMISTLTFDRLVTIYEKFLIRNDCDDNAKEKLLDFLSWGDEIRDDEFGQDIKIVLASSDFSKELATTVLWLINSFGVDIRCVRMHPYITNGETIIDVQTVIPVPEAADYQIQIKEKKIRERESRSRSRDWTKFDLKVAGNNYELLSKRWVMQRLISDVIENGSTPQDVMNAVKWRKDRLFEVINGECNPSQVQAYMNKNDNGGNVPKAKRFFCNEGEFFHWEGKTYVLTNQWGKRTLESVDLISKSFPDLNISIKASG